MPVAARSDEHGSRLHLFPGVRPPRRGQWTAKAHQPRTALVTAAKVSNARMRGTQFSSCNPILPFRMIANPGCLVLYLRHKAATAVLPRHHLHGIGDRSLQGFRLFSTLR